MASARRIASTSMTALRALGAQGQQATQNYSQLTRLVAARLSPRHALIFAEPVPDVGANRIDWYSAAEGDVVPLSSLDPAQRETVLAELRQLGSDIATLAESFLASKDLDQQLIGRLMQLALTYPGDGNVFAVGGRPIITDWGHASTDDSKAPQVLSRSRVALERGRVVRPQEATVEAAGATATGEATARVDPVARTSAAKRFRVWGFAALWFLLGLIIMTLVVAAVDGAGRYGTWYALYRAALWPTRHDPVNALALRQAHAAEIQLRAQLAEFSREYVARRALCLPLHAAVLPVPAPVPAPIPAPSPTPSPLGVTPTPSPSPSLIPAPIPCGGPTPDCARPPPVPSPSPSPSPAQNAEFDERLRRENGKTGGLAVSLLWNNVNKLDLGIIEPSGEHINPDHPRSKTGGTMDVNTNSANVSETPIANIYWPEGQVPAGHYKIFVRYFKANPGAGSGDATPYRIRIKLGDKTEEVSGTLKLGDKPVMAKEFDVPAQPAANK